MSSISWSSKRNITGKADDDLRVEKLFLKLAWVGKSPIHQPVLLGEVSILLSRVDRLQSSIDSLLNVRVFVRREITEVGSVDEEIFPAKEDSMK